jgi:general secretion pathway protein D
MRRADLRRAATALALLAVASSLGAPSLAQSQRASSQGAAHFYAFSFVDADISSVANEILGQTLHLPFKIDPGVNGKITLRIDRRLTPDQLLGVFEAALAANDVVMLRDGGEITLLPKAKARAASGVRSAAPGGTRPGYQVVAEQLRYAAPSDVAKALSAAGAGDIVVHADDKLGVLVLGGTSDEIRRARQTIAVFDRSGLSDARLRFVPLRTAPSDKVAADLDRLTKAAGLTGVSIVSLGQLNAVVIFARSEGLLTQVEAWAQRLDRQSIEETSTLWVYRPNNVAADALAEALRALSQASGSSSAGRSSSPSLSAMAPADAGSPPSAEPVAAGSQGGTAFDADALKVSVEKSTNSLLVMAPASKWRSIKAALDQLDRAPDQILIEATVIEVTLNKDFRLGVDWSLVSSNGKLSATQSAFDSGAVASVFPGLSVTYLNEGVRAVVDALSARTNVEVMSAPKLMALDNQSASLQVGDQVPVVVQRAQSTDAAGAPLVTTTEYRDTGVILRVKPRINGAHSILLDLSQEVSGVAKTTTSGIDSPTITQRKFASLLEVREGETVALGGLISTSHTDDVVGVPLLRNIPAVGSLFRTSTKGGRRTELIVLLNARIVRASVPVADTTNQLKNSMTEMGRRGLLEEQ